MQPAALQRGAAAAASGEPGGVGGKLRRRFSRLRISQITIGAMKPLSKLGGKLGFSMRKRSSNPEDVSTVGGLSLAYNRPLTFYAAFGGGQKGR
jgi:hypothetical protein